MSLCPYRRAARVAPLVVSNHYTYGQAFGAIRRTLDADYKRQYPNASCDFTDSLLKAAIQFAEHCAEPAPTQPGIW